MITPERIGIDLLEEYLIRIRLCNDRHGPGHVTQHVLLAEGSRIFPAVHEEAVIRAVGSIADVERRNGVWHARL
jgi:hypothetical protein